MMTRRLRILFGVVLPALVVCLSASARGPSEEDEESLRQRKAAAARPDVLRLADSLDRDEDEIDKQARAIAEKHDLGAVMRILKPRVGSFTVGSKSDTGFDGIELALLELARKPLPPKELEKPRDDVIRMAKVILAVSRVTPLYAKQYVGQRSPEDRKAWARLCGDMQDGSQRLIEVLKGDDVTAIRKAAAFLNRSCEECHSGFRDSDSR